jgi:RNA polymerase II-associated factor 1
MRYARPEFLETLANDTPLPMIVDAECGMPLDLGLWECLWTDDGDDSGECCTAFDPGRDIGSNDDLNASFSFLFPALNPNLKNLPKLDPKDQYLLGDSVGGSALFVNNVASGSTSSQTVPAVTWLRKTEYITSREGTNRPSSTADQYVPSSRYLECG